MKISTIIVLSMLLCFGIAGAQAPARFNYQGIARNSAGSPLGGALLGMRITIINNSPTGIIVYRETQTTVTNAYGLYNIAIGAGTPVVGTMAGISWNTGNKFIQVEIDPTGGTSYTSLGTTQLLSVPYAMHSATAGSVPLTLTGNTLTAGANSITLPNTAYTAGTGINISAGNVISAQNTNALWNASQIQGNPVSTNTPSAGQILVWTGVAWVPNTVSSTSTFSGTANFVAKYTSTTSMGNSQIEDDGTTVGIGGAALSSANRLQVATTNNTAIAATTTGGGRAVSGVLTGTGTGMAGYFDAGANGKSLIVPGGRVGVGTTAPATTFDLKSTRRYALQAFTDTLYGFGSSYVYDSLPAAVRGEFSSTGGNDGSGVLGVATKTDATYGVGVTGVGNYLGMLGIGTDSGFAAIYAHAHSANYGVFIQGSSGSNAALQTWQSGSTYALYSDGTSYFNGNILGIGTNAYSSDRKLKKDIQPIPSALSTISRIRPSMYRFRVGEFDGMNLPQGRHYGVIAQELQEVLPELVSSSHFLPTPKGREEVKGFDYLSVNYNELIPILIKGMQEQQAIIEQQQGLLEKLEKRIEALEKK